MADKLHLSRVLPLIAAFIVLFSALLDPAISFTLAAACLLAGIAYLVFRTRKPA